MDRQQTFSRETSSETVVISRSKVELEVVSSNLATFSFENYEDHNFRLVLSYPQSREFLNKQDLKEKISEFSSLVLKTDQYVLLFRVNYVSVGQLADYYLISFNGNVSGVYLEVETTELVMLLTTLLESYFTCVQESEFLPLYFEVDAQTIITPTSKSIGVPQAYDFSVTFREFMTNEAMWNIVDLSGIIDVVTNELEASTIERVIASVWEHSKSLLEAGNEFTSKIFSSGSEVEAEITTEFISSATEVEAEIATEFISSATEAELEILTEFISSGSEAGVEIGIEFLSSGAEIVAGILEIMLELLAGLLS